MSQSDKDKDGAGSRARGGVMLPVLVSIMTCLVFFLFLVALIVFIPTPYFLDYLGLKDLGVATAAGGLRDHATQHMLGVLVESGAVITVKEFWQLQSGFYQTIISLLIGINGLLAAAAIFYIKGRSHEIAEDTADKYVKGELFKVRLEKRIDELAKLEFGPVRDEIEKLLIEYDSDVEGVFAIRDNYVEMRQQLRVISERVAGMDTADSEGGDISLGS